MKVEDARILAKQFYSDKGYEHAARVAAYVRTNPIIPEKRRDFCEALAWCHDLLEDTACSLEEIKGKRFKKCLNLLTKRKGTNYNEYVAKIRKNAFKYPESYWVKLADMKDHLVQKETLTDKLKEKYLSGLAEFL